MQVIDTIPYIIIVMILWDFSLHTFDLLHVFNKTKMKHPFGAYLILNYLGGGDLERRKKARSIFWTIYWGIAFILLLLYLTLK